MDILWANIGDFLKAAVPSIIAGIVAWVAIQNWITAKNKLALDLFDRRLKCFQEVMKAVEEWQDEISKTDRPNALTAVFRPLGDPSTKPSPTAAEKFIDAFHVAGFLFGPDVMESIHRISDRLSVERERHLAVKSISSMTEFESAYDLYAKASADTRGAQKEFRRLTRRYMMMGHIAVNRPAKRFRWPWRPKP